MPVLGYERWENFVNAINRAKTSCSDSGIPVSQQFRDTTKVVGTGSGASMEIEDVFMTRYACYLVAMNGDPNKPEIAAAQTYFAVQTRRQELQDNLTEEQKRVELRERVIDANLKLNHVAKSAGVERFDIFHAEGYKGLYGGRNVGEIKQMKGIDPKDDLLDCCERAELAANEFRITQTEEKLLRDRKAPSRPSPRSACGSKRSSHGWSGGTQHHCEDRRHYAGEVAESTLDQAVGSEAKKATQNFWSQP
jgi:DNA-damage-inducible protein D